MGYTFNDLANSFAAGQLVYLTNATLIMEFRQRFPEDRRTNDNLGAYFFKIATLHCPGLIKLNKVTNPFKAAKGNGTKNLPWTSQAYRVDKDTLAFLFHIIELGCPLFTIEEKK